MKETSQARLIVERLRIRTQSGETLVDDISFETLPGSVHAVIGESGSGKTLTTLAILGLLPATLRAEGRVGFSARDGSWIDMLQPDRPLRKIRGTELAAVFQNPFLSLNPVQSVGAAVEEYLRVRGGQGRREARERSMHLFQEYRITPPDERYRYKPRQLSGGLLQRVAILMAAALSPRLIVADEPTSALDATLRRGIMDLLVDLTKSRERPSLLIVTHDPLLVTERADTVTVLRRGRFEGTGTPAALQASPYVRALFQAAPRMLDDRPRLPDDASLSVEGSLAL
ncbi:MAG: ABC transporter ATP-binding protein [Spirochaetia bacterium]|nr:ABC transporter ATP-binding protein [Spirochaetia bacterium]